MEDATGDLPTVEPPFDADGEVSVTGVVLAAGTSSRFGARNKLLARVGGDPLVRRAAEPLPAAGLDDVVVVVGYEADAVRAAVDDLPVRIAVNERYEEGQATSVRTGLDAVDESADAVLFALGDMPDVDADTVALLRDAFTADAGDPLVAGYEGERGNPVLFGRRFFDRLAAVEGDTGGRSVLADAEGTTLVETGDPGVRRDVDRPEDV